MSIPKVHNKRSLLFYLERLYNEGAPLSKNFLAIAEFVKESLLPSFGHLHSPMSHFQFLDHIQLRDFDSLSDLNDDKQNNAAHNCF